MARWRQAVELAYIYHERNETLYSDGVRGRDLGGKVAEARQHIAKAARRCSRPPSSGCGRC